MRPPPTVTDKTVHCRTHPKTVLSHTSNDSSQTSRNVRQVAAAAATAYGQSVYVHHLQQRINLSAVEHSRGRDFHKFSMPHHNAQCSQSNISCGNGIRQVYIHLLQQRKKHHPPSNTPENRTFRYFQRPIMNITQCSPSSGSCGNIIRPLSVLPSPTATDKTLSTVGHTRGLDFPMFPMPNHEHVARKVAAAAATVFGHSQADI